MRDVWLNDLDARTFSIWKFLTSPEAWDIVETILPDTPVVAGQTVDEVLGIPYDECPGLHEICRGEANQGTQGAKGVHRQITSMGAKCWNGQGSESNFLKRKLREVIPEVSHWKITNVDYADLANVDATWFVDPPYANPAGSRYRMSAVDYSHLGWWCLNRKGQVIVCENAGAEWLDFQPFQHSRVSIRSRYQKADAKEVMFYRPSDLRASSTPPPTPGSSGNEALQPSIPGDGATIE